MTSLSNEEEVGVWAWTEDYDLIVVDDGFESTYGIQNRHTGVVEVQESVFSNAINYIIDIQTEYENASALIDEDGSIMTDELLKVTFKTKKEYH